MSVTATRTSAAVPAPNSATPPDGGLPAFVRQFLPAGMVNPSMPAGSVFNPDSWFSPGSTWGPPSEASAPPAIAQGPSGDASSKLPPSGTNDATSGPVMMGYEPGRHGMRQCLVELMRACCCRSIPPTPTQGPPTPTQGPPAPPHQPKPAPSPSSGKPGTVAQADDCHSTDRGTYTVQKGDYLSKIAPRYDLTWQQLFWANKDHIKNPNMIYPGQVLKIPSCDLVPGVIHVPPTRRPHHDAPRPHTPRPPGPPVVHKPVDTPKPTQQGTGTPPTSPKPADPPPVGKGPDPAQMHQSDPKPGTGVGTDLVSPPASSQVPPAPATGSTSGLPPALPGR